MKTIVTHDDVFHADEITAIAVLRILQPDISVERRAATESDLMDPGTVVIDTGRVYNPSNNNYDHHQGDDPGMHRNSGHSPRCSAGLIWKHFGKRTIQYIAELHKLTEITPAVINKLWRSLDLDVIEPIDASDRGVYSSATTSKLSIMSFIFKSKDRRDGTEFLKIVQIFNKFISAHILNELRAAEFLSKLESDKFKEFYPRFLELSKTDGLSTARLSGNVKYLGAVLVLSRKKYKLIVTNSPLRTKMDLLKTRDNTTRYMGTITTDSREVMSEVLEELCSL